MYECDDYEEIRKRIKEERGKYRCIYIKGPKGDKGDKGEEGQRGKSGPVTIKIGNVETVSSISSASITNVGTDEDLILDFKIPKGDKGDKGDVGEKGDVGPRGLPGEIGKSEHISVDETETLEPGEEAQVMDTFEDLVHHLSFFIPRGEKGDIGPQGPTGPVGTSFVSAYGMRYQMTNTQIALPINTDTVIPLPEKGTAFFTEYPEDNSIKIKENGVYLVSYLLSGATNEDCSLTTSVRANDLLQPATNITCEFQAQIINSMSGSTIISLNENDLVTLNVRPSMAVNMIFNGSTSAMLSVAKIH